MPAPSQLINDLCKSLTPDEVRTTLYMILNKLGINTTAFQPGSAIRTVLAAVSTLFSVYTEWAGAAIRGLHLFTATGDWLDVIAELDYSTTRNIASRAGGHVLIENTSAGLYEYEPNSLTLKYYKNGIVYYYSNKDAVTFNNAEIKTVFIEAEVLGSAPNFIPITVPDTTSFTAVGNDNLIISVNTSLLGTDAETDQSLQNRAYLQASAISPNGPSDAYRYVATSTLDSNGAPIASKATVYATPGNVQVYVATDVGSAVDPVGLEILRARIQTTVVPLGVQFTIDSCTEKPISIFYKVYCKKNTTYTQDIIKELIVDKLSKWISEYPIGGYPSIGDAEHATHAGWMYRDAVIGEIESALDRSGIANPIFHTEVTITTNGVPFDSDVGCLISDIISLAAVDGLVIFQ